MITRPKNKLLKASVKKGRWMPNPRPKYGSIFSDAKRTMTMTTPTAAATPLSGSIGSNPTATSIANAASTIAATTGSRARKKILQQ